MDTLWVIERRESLNIYKCFTQLFREMFVQWFSVTYQLLLKMWYFILAYISCRLDFAVQEVEEFVEGAGEDGFVVFTLGSLIASMPKEKAEIFFNAFSKIPQRVRNNFKKY